MNLDDDMLEIKTPTSKEEMQEFIQRSIIEYEEHLRRREYQHNNSTKEAADSLKSEVDLYVGNLYYIEEKRYIYK